jgi:chitinase
MTTYSMRKSALAAAAVVPAALLLAGAVPAQAAQAKAAAAFPAHYSAPYLQISSGDSKDLAADLKASGDKYYTLAFLIPKSGCTPKWEDGNAPVNAFTKQVAALKAAGGNAIISFGGEDGGELAETCTSVKSLTAAYANVVKTYGATRIDFDIENGVQDNTAANLRRDEALAALQKQDPALKIDFTVAVDPTGVESDIVKLLKGAKSAGVKVNLVNIMTMDFGAGDNPLTDSESAATGTEKQLAAIFGGNAAQNWARLGLTPIAGRNDAPDNEVFTKADASALESFAKSHGVQELAFWEVDGYDKPTGYAYSKIFNKI